MKTLLLACAAALVLAWQAVPGTRAHETGTEPKTGVEAETGIEGPADDYVYELAAPGTYSLPAIRPATNARLVDDTGADRELARLFEGRITLLAFIYTRCGDICPVATLRMADLQRLAARMPAVAGTFQLVSLSFDPAYDTPARLADYARHMRADTGTAPPWTFLTARSTDAIAPVLKAYDQPVARKPGGEDATGPFSHLLRVFLIDRDGMIRNIYSADFLDPRLVLNDVRTLLAPAPGTPSQ